jgi:HlyD family secretion protein
MPFHEPETPRPLPTVVPPTRPKSPRKTIWGISLAVVVLAGGLAYYLNGKQVLKGGGPVITAPTVTVAIGDVTQTVRITGTVVAQNYQALLAPRIQGSRADTNRGGMQGALGGGRAGGGGGGGGGGPTPQGGRGGPGGDFNLTILSMVKAGMHVKKDDVVAQFDPTNQQQRLDDYKDMVAQTDFTIKRMLANLAANKESLNQRIRAAKASWDRAELDLTTAEVRSAIDKEKYKLNAEQNQADYKELTSELPLQDESQLAQIRISELTLQQSAIESQRSENNVKKLTIQSPMDGIAVMASIVRNGEYGQVREGDQVNAGQPFLTIVDPSSMVLNATVNQVDAERLRLGMKATVHLDAYPDVSLPGTLVGIGAMSKTSTFRAGYVGEIPVRLKIDKMDPRVIPDLTGSADVVLSSVSSSVMIPRAAVFQENGNSFVFVKGAEGWIKKQIMQTNELP